MRVFDVLKSKNIDELVEWFDEYCMFDSYPWMDWFGKNYCNKCDAVYYDGDRNEYGWCEVYDKCKYFQDMDNIPDNKQTIKMWLESEAE